MSNNQTNNLQNILPLKPEEEDLIKFIHELQWGHFTVEVKYGLPAMIKQPQQDIKLLREDRPNRSNRRREERR